MNVLAAAIRLYQRSPVVNTAVHLSVRVHHALTPRGCRAVCPYRGQCSATGLAAAGTLGMKALPAILSRMSRCTLGEGYTGSRPGRLSMPHPLFPDDGGCP
jgi:hypothetical protein